MAAPRRRSSSASSVRRRSTATSARSRRSRRDLRVSDQAKAKLQRECVDRACSTSPLGPRQDDRSPGSSPTDGHHARLTTSGPAIRAGRRPTGILTKPRRERQCSSSDEVHQRLRPAIEELLHRRWRTSPVSFVIDKGLSARALRVLSSGPSALVAATHAAGRTLSACALTQRSASPHHLDFHAEDELTRIVTRSAAHPRREDRAAGGARERSLRRSRGAPRISEPAAPPRPRLRAGEGRRDHRRGHRARALDQRGVDARGLTGSTAASSARSSTHHGGGRSASTAIAATVNDGRDPVEMVIAALSPADRLPWCGRPTGLARDPRGDYAAPGQAAARRERPDSKGSSADRKRRRQGPRGLGSDRSGGVSAHVGRVPVAGPAAGRHPHRARKPLRFRSRRRCCWSVVLTLLLYTSSAADGPPARGAALIGALERASACADRHDPHRHRRERATAEIRPGLRHRGERALTFDRVRSRLAHRRRPGGP